MCISRAKCDGELIREIIGGLTEQRIAFDLHVAHEAYANALKSRVDINSRVKADTIISEQILIKIIGRHQTFQAPGIKAELHFL